MTLLKKINPSWQPSENPGLKVGDTIEITDPKALILTGAAVAVGERGEDLGAVELYGVLTKSDLEEFKRLRALQNEEKIQEKLKSQQAELKEKLEEPSEPKPLVSVEKLPVPSEEEFKAKRLANLAKARAVQAAKK